MITFLFKPKKIIVDAFISEKHMTIKRLAKEQEEQNEKKCPFGFGDKK